MFALILRVKLSLYFALIVFFLGSSGAISGTRVGDAAPAPNIVATTAMIADAARQIGGDGVKVRALMGPGVDPHAYRPTRTDIAAMVRADLVLWHGLSLEAQMQDFLTDLSRRKPVIALAEQLPKEDLLGSHDIYDNHFDPHIWMDPSLWRKVVMDIADALISARPSQKHLFEANLEIYLTRLDKLKTYGHEILQSVPPNARILLTAHDAFNYFGKAYGFEVMGIEDISTQSEVGLFRINQLVDILVENKIRAVFVESSVTDRNIKALIEGAAARHHEVIIGGELFSDAMGQPGTYEGTYIGMMDHNITTITHALGGVAPLAGMDGALAKSELAHVE